MKLPTAEEYLESELSKISHKDDLKWFSSHHTRIMIEFTKLHVTAALEAVIEYHTFKDKYTLNDQSIIDSYPLTNIK